MKTIIFDMDGTLADSIELALDIAHEITDIPRLSDEELERIRSLPPTKIIRELRIPLRHLPRLATEWRHRMHERIDEVHPHRGVPSALRELHDQGYHMLVISSNSEQNIRSFLRANKLEHYFSGVYGNVGVFGKAAALRKAIRRNNINRESCFYVGDEVRDIMAAKKVGVPIIAVGWGYQNPAILQKYEPFALISKPSELAPLFRTNSDGAV